MRHAITLLTIVCALSATPVYAAKWVPNPSQPGQWIDLDSRRPADPTDAEVIRFDVSMSADPDTGAVSTAEDDLVIELLNCTSGKRLMLLPMLDNQIRNLPPLSQTDPLLRLICG